MAKNRIQELKYQLQHMPMVVKYEQWYHKLAEREQKAVYSVSVLLVLALLYSLIWSPAQSGYVKAQKALQRELSLHQWMQDNRHRVAGAGATSAGEGGSLLAVINQTARKQQITLSRFEPDGEQGVRIWLEKAPFDDVMAWVQHLETQGVVVSQLNADRDGQGFAGFRITFRR